MKKKLAICVLALLGIAGAASTLIRDEEVTTKMAAPASSETPMVDSILARKRAAMERVADDRRARTPVLATPAPRVQIIPPEFTNPVDESQLMKRAPSIYPGSIVVDDIFDRHFEYTKWSNENISAPAAAAFDQCKRDFVARGGKLATSSPFATMALHIVGNGERIQVVEVLADPSIWPASFDDEIKSCLIESLLGHGASSSSAVDMLVDYPVCLDSPSEQKEGTP